MKALASLCHCTDLTRSVREAAHGIITDAVATTSCDVTFAGGSPLVLDILHRIVLSYRALDSGKGRSGIANGEYLPKLGFANCQLADIAILRAHT